MIESADEFRRLRLSDDPAEYARASSEEAPLAVWSVIVDRYPDLRFWVAQNKTVPVHILERLASDRDPRVRWVVAAKRRLPEQLQLQLARDPDEGVRQRLARNPKLSSAALEILKADEAVLVRTAAVSRGSPG